MDQLLFDKISEGIKSTARPLELALLNYHFFDGNLDDVIRELAKYQNVDGGFGHGLEPDFLNPNSSPLQCFTAMHIIRNLSLPSDHEMIKSLLIYLETSYQKDLKRWLNTIPSNDDYPHAPWWSYDANPQVSFNPSASIAGFIFLYANPSSTIYSYAKEVIYEAILHINLKKEPIEVHELRCLIDLAHDLNQLSEEILSPSLKDSFFRQINQVIEPDEKKWFTSYSAKPTSLLKEYPAFYSSTYENLLVKEFDLAIAHLEKDGLWPVTWDWGTNTIVFESSKKAWKAIIALDYLILMKKMNY